MVIILNFPQCLLNFGCAKISTRTVFILCFQVAGFFHRELLSLGLLCMALWPFVSGMTRITCVQKVRDSNVNKVTNLCMSLFTLCVYSINIYMS